MRKSWDVVGFMEIKKNQNRYELNRWYTDLFTDLNLEYINLFSPISHICLECISTSSEWGQYTHTHTYTYRYVYILEIKGKTYRTAISECLDIGTGLITQLFFVSSQEAQCSLISVGSSVISPGHWVVAVIGEVLTSPNAEQPQESQLHHSHRLTVRIHIRKLGEKN